MSELREFIKALRKHNADTVTRSLCRSAADKLENAQVDISDLEARLRIAEKRAEDAESRNDFLIRELDNLIEKARQT